MELTEQDQVNEFLNSVESEDLGICAPKAGDIGIKEFEAKLQICFDLKAQHDKLKKEAAEVWHKLEDAQLKLGMDLEALERDNIKTGIGNFSYKDEQSYLMPKSDVEREKLFNYLKEKGVYDNLITIHSQTLNSYAKQEEAIAKEEGKFDFQLPGVGRGEVTRKFSMTQIKSR